jgi:hypothetical protein
MNHLGEYEREPSSIYVLSLPSARSFLDTTGNIENIGRLYEGSDNSFNAHIQRAAMAEWLRRLTRIITV